MRKQDFIKIPDKKKEPFTYSRWKEYGMLYMSPAERVLMWGLAQIVKYIVPKMEETKNEQHN